MSGTATTPERKTKEKTKLKKQPPYNVILHNDDDHSFDYVIRMLKELFAHPEETGFKMAEEVHTKGKVIVCTTSLERAELKQRPNPRLRSGPADRTLPGVDDRDHRAGGIRNDE